MDDTEVKTKEATQRAGDRVVRGMVGVSALFARIDQRAVVGLLFLALALVLVSYAPQETTGTARWLHENGLSPRGYGFALSVAGGLILRWPRTRFYGVLTLAFLPYLIGTVGYMAGGGINPAPAILYVVLYYFILRAE